MKKLLVLFFIVSFLCFGEDTQDNKNMGKSIQMKEEIGLLKNQVTELKTELEEVKKKDNKNQVYLDSLKYYERAKDDAKEIYNKSTEDAKEIFSDSITLIIAILGLIGALLGIVQFRNSKQLEKERKTLGKLKEDTEKKIKEFNYKINDVEFNSKFGIAINKKNSKEKLAELKNLEKNIINLSPKNKKLLYFQLAYNSLNKKEIESYYTKTIEIDPTDSRLFINRGLNNYDKDRAMKDFNKAIDLDPQNSDAYMYRGLLKDNLNLNNAIEDYNKAIKLDPNNMLAYMYRGKLRNDLNIDGAMEDYNEAIKLDPKNSLAYYNRGTLKIDLFNIDGAMEDYNKAIKLDPNNISAYINRGLTHSKLKQYDSAVWDFSKAIDYNPDDLIPYINRGVAKANLKNYDFAINDYNKAIKLDPSNILCYNNRAESLLFLKKYRLALDDLVKCFNIGKEWKFVIDIHQENYDGFKRYLEKIKGKTELEEEVYNRLLDGAKAGFEIRKK